MPSHHYLARQLIARPSIAILLAVQLAVLFACSSGPAEKTEPEPFTAPARMLDQGVYFYNINDYAEAIDHFEKALLQYRSIDNQPGIANSCLNLANSYMAISNVTLAAEYLAVADNVIEQSSLTALDEHLSLLKSSLAISTERYDLALQELAPVLNSSSPEIKLAALKNRTTVAFIINDDDRLQWLDKYRTLQRSHPENSSSHLARILRFDAEAAEDTDTKFALLAQSLALSQKLANRTAIAATLEQWGNVDIDEKRLVDAEDKYLRALFIRHQLGDVKNSLAILKHLQVIYRQTDKNREQLTDSWISKIENNELSDWDTIITDLDNYPKHE